MGAAVTKDQPIIRDLSNFWKPLNSVFGYSSACVPSIMSGRWPEEHLHWSYFTHGSANPALRIPKRVKWLPPAIRDRGRVRRWCSQTVARHNHIDGYFQLYNMPMAHLDQYGHCEPKNIFTPGGLNRGRSIIDDLKQAGTNAWLSDWKRSVADNWQAMAQAAGDSQKTFLFMYDPSLDGWLHEHTRDDSQLTQRLGQIRRDIDRILAIARGHHDEVRFHIWSDHGMCTIQHHLNIHPLLEATGLRMHRDYHCVIDSTMVRFWYHGNDHIQQRIRDVFHGQNQIKLVSRNQLKKWRCNFPDNRFGDDIFLADPHCLLVPSHMGAKPINGMHGFSPEHEDSDATYITNDPSHFNDTTSIVDCYGLMKAAIGEQGGRKAVA